MRTKRIEADTADQEREVARYNWLSTAEAGALAGGVSDATVREWIGAGHLKALNINVGGKPEYRIKPEWLEAFVAKQTVNEAA